MLSRPGSATLALVGETRNRLCSPINSTRIDQALSSESYSHYGAVMLADQANIIHNDYPDILQ